MLTSIVLPESNPKNGNDDQASRMLPYSTCCIAYAVHHMFLTYVLGAASAVVPAPQVHQSAVTPTKGVQKTSEVFQEPKQGICISY